MKHRMLRVNEVVKRELSGIVAREISFDEISKASENLYKVPGEEIYLNIYPVGLEEKSLPGASITILPVPSKASRRHRFS